ncbi:MAG: Rieske 2Fe-2S domain-containing protein [Thermoguttaceae bacterium]
MKNPTSPCCCRSETNGKEHNRRGFLGQATAVACGAVALATPTVAGVVTFLNPLRQKSQGGQFMRLASLDTISQDGTPLKVPVIADRTDAWSRFPAEPIGAVFLRRSGGSVTALQVICPHAGCSINYDAAGRKYFCPCHAASFDLSGKRTDATSPSPRNMDSLKVEIRDKNQVYVKFQTFCVGTTKKIAQA